MLSMTTVYCTDTERPEPYLKRIAEAGFSHLHWGHHWDSDFLYSQHEIEQIADWMECYGLRLCDVHGSAGQEKNWGAFVEYERLAGVELVQNRIEMAARLGSDVVVMHLPPEPEGTEGKDMFKAQLQKSLDELNPCATENGVCIALENGVAETRFGMIEWALSRYDPAYVGVCYDAGHGNIHAGSLDWLERWKDRLAAIHLHDNDGSDDQHRLPFAGTVDWERLVRIIAQSSYTKCVNLESMMYTSPIKDEGVFLAEALRAGERISEMIDAHR